MSENKAKTKKKSRRGRPPKHGGFSIITAKGELPENRKYIRKYLTAARENLIKDLGPTEKDLTAAQIIIIYRVVTKLGIIRCIEEHIRENSVMEGNELAPALKASYLAYNNSIRLDLMALGIDKRQADTPSLQSYINSRYGKGEEARE